MISFNYDPYGKMLFEMYEIIYERYDMKNLYSSWDKITYSELDDIDVLIKNSFIRFYRNENRNRN